MFNPSILELESQIQYHQEQQELAEQELDRLKMTQAFAEDAAEKVEDALEHIDPKYVDVFKEHLLSLFPVETPHYLEEQEATLDGRRTNDYVEKINSHPIPTKVKEEKEFGSLSYYELTGRPDTRPDKYEDIAPNITYSSSGRAYVGFNDRTEAEEFREHLEMPSMLDEAVIMNNHKWEVKFYCDRSYLEELEADLNDWTPDQKAELDWQEQLVRIAPDIFYDPSTSKCFVGFTNYQRANTYGAHLKEIHELYDSRYTVGKPSVVTNCKHELVIESIAEENARKLSGLNLKKELDNQSNKAVTSTWDTKIDNARGTTNDIQLSRNSQEEDKYPLPPYKSIPLSEVELADIVTTSANAQSAYEVTANLGDHLLATCLYNHSLKHREGQKDFWITEAYLVQKGDMAATVSGVTA